MKQIEKEIIDWNILRENLIDLKNYRNLTYKQIAEMIGGVAPGTISNFMCGVTNTLGSNLVIKLCEIFGVDSGTVSHERIKLIDESHALISSENLILRTIETLNKMMKDETLVLGESKEGSCHAFMYTQATCKICVFRYKNENEYFYEMNINSGLIINNIPSSEMIDLKSLWEAMKKYKSRIILDPEVKSFLESFLKENNPMLIDKNKQYKG